MKRLTAFLLAACGLLWRPTGAWAQDGDPTTYTQHTFYEWVAKYKNAKAEFKAGDILTNADLEKVRPFMMPGYFEQFEKWKELKMEIVETHHVKPHKLVLDCNEKFQKPVKLAADDALENYVCGYPFANEEITDGDPKAGIKAAWNYDKRWSWRGYHARNALATWFRFGGTHTAPEPEMPPEAWRGTEYPIKPEDWKFDTTAIYGGGGKFERSLGCFYHRAYYSHLPMFEKSNYQLPGMAEATAAVHWKEFTGFFSPFNVRGTTFIITRYDDPRRPDDGWAYIPSLRRVRRISAEIKSDSLMGTEHTLEDFYSFSGRPLEWNWKFHGWKDMLAVHVKTKWEDDGVRYGGPDGWLNNDVWQMRKMLILERFPKDPRHPYGSVFMSIDPETWEGWTMVAFDRKGKLWKLWQWGYAWSDDAKRFTDMNHGRSAAHWRNVETVDLQNGRGSLWREYGGGLPDFSVDFLTKLYDLNRLTELHW